MGFPVDMFRSSSHSADRRVAQWEEMLNDRIRRSSGRQIYVGSRRATTCPRTSASSPDLQVGGSSPTFGSGQQVDQ
jgi:hypothetical protein